MTGLWGTADGSTFTYEGKHYRIADSPGLPKPVQRPRPAHHRGRARTTRAPRLAATYAAEFNLAFSSLDETRSQFERVRSACGSVGRDPASSGVLRRPGRVLWPYR